MQRNGHGLVTLIWGAVLLLTTSLSAQFSGGDGTSGNPYQVTTAAELSKIRDFPAASFKLMNDIDLTAYLSSTGAGYNEGAYWKSIEVFNGVLDGDNHKITGMKSNRPGENYVALIGDNRPSGCVVKNLGVEMASEGLYGHRYVGAIVGYASEIATKITNCYSKGSIKGKYFTGGIVGGHHNSALVSECYSTADIVVTNSYGGGIVGYNESGRIEDCYFNGTASGPDHIGGITSENKWAAIISRCYASGLITCTTNKGGIIASELESSVQPSVVSSFWDIEKTGLAAGSSSFGIGKSSADLKIQTTYTGWDFTNIWRIGTHNDGYPYLAKQTLAASKTYKVQAKHSGLYLELNSDNSLSQQNASSALTQIWLFTDVKIPGKDSVFVKILNIQSQNYLQVPSGNNANGTLLFCGSYSGAPYQLWYVKQADNGTCYIINRGSNKAVNVNFAGLQPGAQIIQQTPEAAALNDKWTLFDVNQLDLQEPKVTAISGTSVFCTSPMNITITVTDETGVASVEGFYQLTGQTGWTSFTMTAVPATQNYTGTLPAPSMGKTGKVKFKTTDTTTPVANSGESAEYPITWLNEMNIQWGPLIGGNANGMDDPWETVIDYDFGTNSNMILKRIEFCYFNTGTSTTVYIGWKVISVSYNPPFITKTGDVGSLNGFCNMPVSTWLFNQATIPVTDYTLLTGKTALVLTLPGKFSMCNDQSGTAGHMYYSTTTGGNSYQLMFDNAAWSIRMVVALKEGSSAVEEVEVLPGTAYLAQNYPNPFNPTTTIDFYNNMSGRVKLTVLNSKGETVKTLIHGLQNAGHHSVNFDATGLNSGVYFYKLETANGAITKKMLLVK